MRLAIVALVLGVALIAGPTARADQPTGFAHIVHDGRIAVSGRDPIACATCHPLGARGALIGRPGHSACLGTCHAAPGPGRPSDAAVCTACHPAEQLAARRPAVAFPPYQLDPDFGLTFDHARHQAAACTTCHAIPGTTAAAPRPHARCAPCHDGRAAAPAMTACAACHPAGTGVNLRPTLASPPLAVGAAFDHRRHLSRAPRAAALACATCHAGLAATADLALPTPGKATCTPAGCHDGVAGFAATTACTRCHTAAPTEPYAVHRPIERFDHGAHERRAPLPTCTSCHRLDRGGQPLAPDHDACAACHAADLTATKPTICGACHLATEPWRPLAAALPPRPRSEFGVELAHARHAAVACERCHQLTTATRELRPPRGHAACADAGCHGDATGPAPPLDACVACHGRDREANRDRARAAAPWSVRVRFRHRPHRTHDGQPVPCVTCHGAVAASAAVVDLPSPGKATCAPCHDGVAAFRMTGHGCARCHGR